MTRSFVAAVGITLAAATSSVSAQQLPPAGVISPEFQRRALEPERAPLAEPTPEVPTPEPLEPRPVEGETFPLGGIVLEGATVLDEAELRPLWQPLIGTEVNLATLDEVAARITAAYRAEGYVLTQALVPAQTIDADRVVLIQVVEGFIDQVEVSGGKPSDQAIAERLLAPAAEDRPLQLGDLERGVLLSRDTLRGSVETVLQPSPDVFGAADLEVLIEPQPFDGFAVIDNRGSRLLGPWIARGGLGANNTLGFGERLEVLGAASLDTPRLWFGQVAGILPIAALDGTWFDGGRVGLRADAIRTEPDLDEVIVDDFSTIQREYNVNADFVVPFIRSRASNLFGALAINWRDSTADTKFFGTDLGTETDRLLSITPRVTYDWADRWGGVSEVLVEWRQGIRIDGVTQVDATGPVAPADDFTAFGGLAQRIQRLGNSNWSLLGKFIWQYGATTLPVSERFALGGEALGRGFAPGNTTGDSGYGGRLELRYLAEFPEVAGQQIASTFYGFGDWGTAVDRSTLRDGDKRQQLGSIGLGARVDITDSFTLTPEVVRQVAGQAFDTSDPDLETRFLFGAVARF